MQPKRIDESSKLNDIQSLIREKTRVLHPVRVVRPISLYE